MTRVDNVSWLKKRKNTPEVNNVMNPAQDPEGILIAPRSSLWRSAGSTYYENRERGNEAMALRIEY